MRRLMVGTLLAVLGAGCSGSGVTPGPVQGGAVRPFPVELSGEAPRVEALRPSPSWTAPLLSGALGTQVAPADERPERSVRLRPWVRIGEGQTRSIHEAALLVLTAEVAHAEGERELAVELVTPTQADYARRVVNVTLEKDELHTESFSFPVAGTQIEFSGLVGTWSARFLLDGRELAVTDFELTP